jgi:hypothetical protein
MKTTIEETTTEALDHVGRIVELLAPMLAVTPDAKLLRVLAVTEAAGELQDRLFDLRDP